MVGERKITILRGVNSIDQDVFIRNFNPAAWFMMKNR